VVEEGEDLAGAYRSINAVNLASSDGMEPTSELVYKRLRVSHTRRGEQSRVRIWEVCRSSEQVEKEDANETERERATTRELFFFKEPPERGKF
jgi:hypothetical protein